MVIGDVKNDFSCVFFFKQKTAYEIMPSLVGSEMCIRDRSIDPLLVKSKVKVLSDSIQLIVYNPEQSSISFELKKISSFFRLSNCVKSLNTFKFQILFSPKYLSLIHI
eukprot:TRINITY_DN38217_c0_g1_i1.p3 TRINITY_DN38217_c0_g1~~TRINITY_DN38217_c0_g1_i1.p3  ORF type:complete len:108 (-),score=20.34 TRINITY_DN38217_c0_g1_i1:129-452(-)